MASKAPKTHANKFRVGVEQKKAIEKATLQMRDAIQGKSTIVFDKVTFNQRAVYEMQHRGWYHGLLTCSNVGIMLLPFLYDLFNPHHDLIADINQYFLMFDALFLLIALMDICLAFVVTGFAEIRRKHRWTLVRFVCILVVAMGLPRWNNKEYASSFWAFRPIIVIASNIYSRATLESITMSFWNMRTIVILVLSFIVFFGLAALIFLGYKSDSFVDLTDSTWAMTVSFFSITEQISYMNPILDGSNEYYYSGFFVVFTLFGCIFLMKLIVAAAMKTFKQRMQALYLHLLHTRNDSALKAFRSLADHPDRPEDDLTDAEVGRDFFMSKHVFIQLLRKLVPVIGDSAESVFKALTTNTKTERSHFISWQEFTGVFWVLDQNWTVNNDPRDWISTLYHATHNAIITEKELDGSMTTTLTVKKYVSGLLMFVRKLVHELTSAGVTIYNEEIIVLDLIMFVLTGWYIFTLDPWVLTVFVVEIGLKMYGFGPQRYFYSNLNTLDFITIGLTLFFEMFGDGDSDDFVILFFLVIASRLLRLTILFLNLTSYTRETVMIVVRTLPFLGEFALIYFGGIYFFAAVSRDLYGNMLQNCVFRAANATLTPCDPLLESTSWWNNSPMYNWESFTNSYVAMFYTTRTQGWTAQMKAPYVFGATEKNAAKLFFFSYRFMMSAVFQPFGLAMIVALWRAFATRPESGYDVKLGDFQVRPRNNKIYVLRKLYGEVSLRKYEGRKILRAHETKEMEDDHPLKFYVDSMDEREQELQQINEEIADLKEQLSYL